MMPSDLFSVLSILPHRAPFVLVDKVIAWEQDRWIRAIRKLTADDPFDDPLMTERATLPSPLLIEAIAQAAAVLLLSSRPRAVPALIGIERATFCGEARAGDSLHLYAEVCWLRRQLGRARGKAVSDSGIVLCEAEFTFGWSFHSSCETEGG